MNIQDKYSKARPLLKTGTLVLFHGTHLLAKIIQFFTKSYYNHIGIVMVIEQRVFIIDSNAAGVKPDFMSNRINDYTDFCVIQPLQSNAAINTAMNEVIGMAEQGISYDFMELPRIAVEKIFGKDLASRWGNGKAQEICSEWARQYCIRIPVPCYQKMPKEPSPSPQDFLTYADPKDVAILLNDHSAK